MAERELLAIKRVQRERLQKQQRIDYDKYVEVFDAVQKFFRGRKDVLMYGGQALDDVLPSNQKIYEKYTLPDIDLFSYNARALAGKLRDYLTSKGYKYAHVGDALHENTFKVFCEGLQVVDISYVTRRIFKALKVGSLTRSMGIQISSLMFLRGELHNTLAMPRSNHRWESSFDRLVKFYKVFPPKPVDLPLVDTPPGLLGIISSIYQISATHNCIHIGIKEVLQILGRRDPANLASTPPIVAIVPGNLDDFADDLARLPSLRVSKVLSLESTEHTPYVLAYSGKALIAVFMEATRCYSYIKHEGHLIGTVHTIAAHYIRLILTPSKAFYKMRPDLEACTNAITHLQITSLGAARNKLLDQVQTDCLGPEVGLITMRRHRIKRREYH
jgi:Poly(A) polymerase catalytic subunit